MTHVTASIIWSLSLKGGREGWGGGAVLSTKLNIPALINTCFFLYDGYLEQ